MSAGDAALWCSLAVSAIIILLAFFHEPDDWMSP